VAAVDTGHGAELTDVATKQGAPWAGRQP
jgi:hypothetical protein